MKKRAIFKIIIFSVIGVVLIGVLIYGLTNKKVRSGLSLGGFFYANASEYKVAEEKVQLSDLTIDEIEVNWIGGNVLIKYSEDATISFKETFDNKDENSNYLMRYLVKNFANEIRKQFIGASDSYTDTIEVTLSTRTLLRWADLTLRFQPLAHQGIQPLSYALDRALGFRASRPTRAMLHELLQRMFPMDCHLGE